MRKTVWYAIAFAMFLVVVLLVAPLHAMEIYKFDKMADADQGEYIVMLVQGAQTVLKDDGRPDDAMKVHKLFTTNAENGASIGMNDFMMALAIARKSDADRVVKGPNAVRLEVEHAMILALKRNGITLPKSFMAVMKGFKLKHPPQDQ